MVSKHLFIGKGYFFLLTLDRDFLFLMTDIGLLSLPFEDATCFSNPLAQLSSGDCTVQITRFVPHQPTYTEEETARDKHPLPPPPPPPPARVFSAIETRRGLFILEVIQVSIDGKRMQIIFVFRSGLFCSPGWY